MVETSLSLIVVLIVVALAFYGLGVANGFEDGKKFERERTKQKK